MRKKRFVAFEHLWPDPWEDEVSAQPEETKCASCKADVVWLTQVKKDGSEQRHIFDAKPAVRWVLGEDGKVRSASTYVSHWATCPTREQHRKEW